MYALHDLSTSLSPDRNHTAQDLGEGRQICVGNSYREWDGGVPDLGPSCLELERADVSYSDWSNDSGDYYFLLCGHSPMNTTTNSSGLGGVDVSLSSCISEPLLPTHPLLGT